MFVYIDKTTSDMAKPRILLVNPYIYDFAAYDLWIKPLGLLYIGAVLEENGCECVLLDALDRWHPDVLRRQGLEQPKSKPYGDGHFCKEEVAKPAECAAVPRRYYRYGMPPDIFRTNLERIRSEGRIDAVLVTSGMTYWYRGVHEAIAWCREVFPLAPILLGGIYATLFTDHARRHAGADRVFKGEGEQAALDGLAGLLGLSPVKRYEGYDELPLPAYHLYPRLDYVALMTSRGCPYSCSFCATHEFTETFHRRDPEAVVREIEHHARRVRNITFYDDALFVNADRHIKPVLRAVIERGPGLNFHTPNGLFAKLLDAELAELLVESGFKTIRLSYETLNPERQRQMRKVSDSDLERALAHLERAGFPRHLVTVYLIMGLPGQRPSEVADSIRYVNGLGGRVSLSSFSPIPNTPEWRVAVTEYGFPADQPLLTNKSIYPLRNERFRYDDFERLKRLGIECNRSLHPSQASDEPHSISDYNVYA